MLPILIKRTANSVGQAAPALAPSIYAYVETSLTNVLHVIHLPFLVPCANLDGFAIAANIHKMLQLESHKL